MAAASRRSKPATRSRWLLVTRLRQSIGETPYADNTAVFDPTGGMIWFRLEQVSVVGSMSTTAT
jgi:hypothetical protein